MTPPFDDSHEDFNGEQRPFSLSLSLSPSGKEKRRSIEKLPRRSRREERIRRIRRKMEKEESKKKKKKNLSRSTRQELFSLQNLGRERRRRRGVILGFFLPCCWSTDIPFRSKIESSESKMWIVGARLVINDGVATKRKKKACCVHPSKIFCTPKRSNRARWTVVFFSFCTDLFFSFFSFFFFRFSFLCALIRFLSTNYCIIIS